MRSFYEKLQRQQEMDGLDGGCANLTTLSRDQVHILSWPSVVQATAARG